MQSESYKSQISGQLKRHTVLKFLYVDKYEMWKCKITFCPKIGEKQENSAHTSSVTNSKQTQKYCPWKTALARHQTIHDSIYYKRS